MSTLHLPLTQGKSTLIDEADYPLVAPYRWRAQRNGRFYYAEATILREDGHKTAVKMHRIIMAAPPGSIIDHANRDALDNRRSNLRFATQSQNTANSRMHHDNTSGYRGVCFREMNGSYRRTKPWQAVIKCDGVYRSLGYYATAQEAARAYDTAARALFGPFARCNFEEDAIP